MHAKHARQNLMIDAITWLFAIGAVITAVNFFVTKASGVIIQHMIFGHMTVNEAISVSGWAIFFAGFFYALVVVKPELLRRQREYRVMSLKLEAANNPQMYDAKTGVHSREYFEKLLAAYFKEFKELDRNLWVFSVKIGCDPALYDFTISGVVGEIHEIIKLHDENAILARLDDNTLAIVSPFIEHKEAAAFESALHKAVSNSSHLPFMAKCDIEHANYPRYSSTADGNIRGVFATLGVPKNYESPKLEVVLSEGAQ